MEDIVSVQFVTDNRIGPDEVPEYAWDYGCRELANAITMALKNPTLRAEYEKFRAEYTQ